MLLTKELYKVYEDGAKEIRAVDGVSLEIGKNQSVAIIGPSGAGKSTLLHLLGGLDHPTSGNVVMDGVDIYGLSDNERARLRNRRIGFVFQFYNLLPEFTALENVMLPALIKSRGIMTPERHNVRDRAMGILKAIGLEDRITHKPPELSGGEAQRVAIARALINDPEILLCDEPTGNLDSKNSNSIYDLLFSLKAKSGIVLVIVTHDEDISKRTERTIRIKDGRIV